MRMEMIFIPLKNGKIKVFIYGFSNLGTWGNVVAEFNGTTVTSKGFNKKRTLVRSISKLHETLAKKGRKND
jgi:hypothetical protein